MAATTLLTTPPLALINPSLGNENGEPIGSAQTHALKPLEGPMVWEGSRFADTESFVVTLTSTDIADVDAALAFFQGLSSYPHAFTQGSYLPGSHRHSSKLAASHLLLLTPVDFKQPAFLLATCRRTTFHCHFSARSSTALVGACTTRKASSSSAAWSRGGISVSKIPLFLPELRHILATDAEYNVQMDR